MYVRRKTLTRKTVTDKAKPYTYYQLVEGRRVDGRVRQKVVKHLGDWPDRERAEIHARRLGILCGAQGCNQRASAGPFDLQSRGQQTKLCTEHGRQVDDGARTWEEPILCYPLY